MIVQSKVIQRQKKYKALEIRSSCTKPRNNFFERKRGECRVAKKISLPMSRVKLNFQQKNSRKLGKHATSQRQGASFMHSTFVFVSFRANFDFFLQG